ncbi:zinc finger protein 704-like protein [Leptotrombidium deliense]|uniref:Zinc finger protein 704-like protein n=1 Tax=Leptotrombidium deliense TaxID=299467 RepID=A0A443SRI7_9ACAR|nr:zinc finger protein 704-like protein [Leptotrombidium deliense]
MNAMDECNVAMDDCMAAMVLMSLSCSPKSPLMAGERTADFSAFAVDSMFQCTWPGCGEIRNHCEDIERHVRVEHLGRSADSLDDEYSDHEEEFYYNEIEIFPQHSSSASSASSSGFLPSSLPHKFETVANVMDSGASSSSSIISPTQSPGPLLESDSVPFFASSSAPTWSHLDMVRPPHEDPEYRKFVVEKGDYRKYIVEKVELLHRNIAGNEAHLNNGTGKTSMATHPINIPGSGETKKCRKMYGMDNRESWCTQCKWKKACSRFVD